MYKVQRKKVYLLIEIHHAGFIPNKFIVNNGSIIRLIMSITECFNLPRRCI